MKILVLPGDGIGQEVINEAEKIINEIEKRFNLNIERVRCLVGGKCLEKKGVPIEEETLELARKADAVLLGAVGGPEWDNLPFDKKPEQALLKLRKILNTYANIRPVKVFPSLTKFSPLKKDRLKNVDFIVVRELTGGIYFGEPRGIFAEKGKRKGINAEVYYDYEVERVATVAFEIARRRRKKVTSVDKANVLESSILWRTVVEEVKRHYPDVELNHLYVDNCAMQIIREPSQFDVILTTNMFGDILSDESAVLSGSIGLLPSASVGANKKGLYEPVHGSAPDIRGKGIANPIAAILSTAMMFRYSLGMEGVANMIERAVEKTVEEGYVTPDLNPDNPKTTEDVGERIRTNLG